MTAREPTFLPLPLAGEPVHERSDAARNRAALLCSARHLVDTLGVEAVTMDAVANHAGVGKGTVFRRFGSRAGLMATLLDASERDWQSRVISGPAPLGPGAPPWERLEAFGRSRLENTMLHGDLLRAAEAPTGGSMPAMSFMVQHTQHLLGELGVTGDLRMLAIALMSPLEIGILDALQARGIDMERVLDGWLDLARRIVEAG